MSMRSRFGRRRRRSAEPEGAAAIDSRWLERITESGLLALNGALEPRSFSDVPDSLALLGLGEAEDGTRQLVAFSPRRGGDALLAALVAARRLARDEEFAGRAAVLSPVWRAADRRRLGVLAASPVPLLCVTRLQSRVSVAGEVTPLFSDSIEASSDKATVSVCMRSSATS